MCEVAEAYLAGLEKLVAERRRSLTRRQRRQLLRQPHRQRGRQGTRREDRAANDPTEKERLSALKGKVAIANAKLAYQHYKRLFAGARWEKLAAKGAQPQRLLWASTGTKNKDYSDVLYVEELIGPNTVNTVPPATLDAFRDHGTPRDSLEENIDDARRVLDRAGEVRHFARRDHRRTGQGRREAVRRCRRQALGAVAHKRADGARRRHQPQQMTLGERLDEGGREGHRGLARVGEDPPALAARTNRSGPAATKHKWLGWLDSADRSADVADYEDFAQRVKGQDFTDAVVLGMGGSSLGPEVLAETFGKQSGFPEAACARFHRSGAGARPMQATIDLAKTAVHRLQQIRQHDRAERDEGLFLRARVEDHRRRQGRRTASWP